MKESKFKLSFSTSLNPKVKFNCNLNKESTPNLLAISLQNNNNAILNFFF